MELELRRTDWQRIEGATSCEHVPDALRAMLTAKNAEQADRAYSQLDNTVVVQGSVYEAGPPALRALLIGLQTATPAGRLAGLNLVEDLCSGGGAEPEFDPHTLVGECRTELANSASFLFYILEAGTVEEQTVAVDLFGVLTLAAPQLTKRFLDYCEELKKCATDEWLLTRIQIETEEIQESP